MKRIALTLLALVTAPVAVATAAPGHRVLANTGHVEDLVVNGAREGGPVVYAATRGGIEVYQLSDGRRLRHYTSADGLPELHVRELRINGGGVEARTRAPLCALVSVLAARR